MSATAVDASAPKRHDEPFKRLIDHIPVAVVMSQEVDGDERIIYANALFESAVGRPFSEFEGKDWLIFNSFTCATGRVPLLGQAILTGEGFLGTFHHAGAEEKLHLLHAYVGRVESPADAESYRLVTLVNVTGRNRSERDTYERLIHDRDMLLREIEHRVKNNLQVITALIH
jgi:two-component sensor histidine kinase